MAIFCYLCHLDLKYLDHQNLIDIFGENGKNFEISTILTQHFWFLIIPQNNITKKICTDCWTKTMEFHTFYKRIRNIQFNQSIIINNYDCDVEQSIKTEISSYPEVEASIIEPTTEIEYIIDGNIKSDQCDDENDDNHSDFIPSDEEQDKVEYIKPVPKLAVKRQMQQNKVIKLHIEQQFDNHESNIEEKEKVESSFKIEKRRGIFDDVIGDEKIRMFFKMDCDVCGINFETFNDVKSHYNDVHNQIGYITCCGKQYFHRTFALRHLSHHLDVKSYICETCNKGFATISSLKLHMDHTHIPNNRKPFKCSVCPKGFMTASKLERHTTVIHHKLKKFECNECGNKFTCKQFLTKHIKKVHENAYAQICEICARVFKCKLSFKHHYIDQHSDVVLPKIQCELCGIWLKNKNTMRSHKLYHNSTVQTCTICQKKFSTKNVLANHMRFVHSGKIYQCTQCEKTFKKPISLKEHMSYHTGENLYTCPYCPNTFKSNSNMYWHKQKKHPNEWIQEREKRGIPAHYERAKPLN